MEKAKLQLGLPSGLAVPESTGTMTLVDEIPAAFSDVVTGGTRPSLGAIAPGYSVPSRAELDAGWLGGERDELPSYEVTSANAIFLERDVLER